MAYASRKPIRWAEVLAHPRDYAIAQHERQRKAYTKAWTESANERDGRVGTFNGGVIGLAYDHRAELINETAPDKYTLRRQAHNARQNRQAVTSPGNRQIGGNF